MTSFSPTATKTGGWIVATISAVIGARDERMHAARAFRSLFVCSAKARNVRAVGLVTSSMLSASRDRAIGPVPAMPRTMLKPRPPKTRRPTRSGCVERQKRGNARAHRIADDMRTRDAEMIEQAASVFRHQRRAIVGQLIELLAFSMTPIVERNDPVTGFDEKVDPAGIDPIRLHIRSKAVDEQYRQLVRAASGIEKRDIDAVAVKMCHCHSR